MEVHLHICCPLIVNISGRLGGYDGFMDSLIHGGWRMDDNSIVLVETVGFHISTW